jgi:hypothetical protein
MFHNFDPTTVPLLIKLATLLLGFVLGSGPDMIIFRSCRNRTKKELILAAAKDTMIVTAEYKHLTHSENSLLPPTRGVIDCYRKSDQICISQSAESAVVL